MTKRFRLRFTFWLDMQKADEAGIAEMIDSLKADRTFASVIRDGIRLMCDLRAGRTDVLFALFPWVREAAHPAPVATADQRLQQQIKRLEELLLAQGNIPIHPPLTASTPPKSSRQAKPKSRVEVTRSAGTGSSEAVAKNFLNSMKGLASGFFD